jgi:hypothetical protein
LFVLSSHRVSRNDCRGCSNSHNVFAVARPSTRCARRAGFVESPWRAESATSFAHGSCL